MWRRPPKGERAPRGPRLFRGVRDPNLVLAAGVRPSVEPAVASVDRETLAFQERKPLLWLEPRELHRRPAVDAAHRQRQRPCLLVPVGALEDRRLALEPTPVRVLDVVARRREDVEDETAARAKQAAHGAEREPPVLVRPHVEQRPERADDQRDLLVDGRLAQVAEPQVDPRTGRASPWTSRRRSRESRRKQSARRCVPSRRRARRSARPTCEPPRGRTARPP